MHVNVKLSVEHSFLLKMRETDSVDMIRAEIQRRAPHSQFNILYVVGNTGQKIIETIRKYPQKLFTVRACTADVEVVLFLHGSKVPFLTITISRQEKVKDVEFRVGNIFHGLTVSFLTHNGLIMQRNMTLDSFSLDSKMKIYATLQPTSDYVIIYSPWKDYIVPWHRNMIVNDILCLVESSIDDDIVLMFKDKKLMQSTESLSNDRSNHHYELRKTINRIMVDVCDFSNYKFEIDVDPLSSVEDIVIWCQNELDKKKLSHSFSLTCGEVTLFREPQCISYFNTEVKDFKLALDKPVHSYLNFKVTFSDEPLSVEVKLPDMTTLILNVSSLTRVYELKNKIEKHTRITRSSQILLLRNEPLLPFTNLMQNRICNNDCLTLDYRTQHIVTDYTNGMKRRQLKVDSTARQSTPAYIKAIIQEKWGYEPEEQELTAELDEGMGMGQQRCYYLRVSHVAAINVHVSLPDGNSLNMKVNPHSRIEDIKREVIKRTSLSPQIDIGIDGQQLHDQRIAMQCLTRGASLHVCSPTSTEGEYL